MVFSRNRAVSRTSISFRAVYRKTRSYSSLEANDRAPAAGFQRNTTGMPNLPDGQEGGQHGLVDSYAAHNPTPPTPLAHRGCAFGLTRFACLSLRRGLRRPVDSLRLPTALAPTLAFD